MGLAPAPGGRRLLARLPELDLLHGRPVRRGPRVSGHGGGRRRGAQAAHRAACRLDLFRDSRGVRVRGKHLADKCPREKAAELARLLSEGTWTHDHPITFETAKSFGLPVRSDIPADFLDLMTLYPQPVRRQPTVEYLPGHRGANGVQGAHN